MAKAWLWAAACLAASLTLGCSSGLGSCTVPELPCQEPESLSGGAEASRAFCEGQSGIYTDGSCSNTGRVARCRVTSGGDGGTAKVVLHYYAPLSVEQVRAECEKAEGEFLP
jgi:hypothetical protein